MLQNARVGLRRRVPLAMIEITQSGKRIRRLTTPAVPRIAVLGLLTLVLSACGGSSGSRVDESDTAASSTASSSSSSVSIADATVSEGDAGDNPLLAFVVSLSQAASENVSVDYQSASGTASAGSDYQQTNGTLVFLPGQTQQTVNVSVIGDTAVESHETMLVNLSNPSGVTMGDASATGTIMDDDTYHFSINDAQVGEGNNGDSPVMTFTVTRMPDGAAVSVDYASESGTAVSDAGAGSDFVSVNGTLSFSPGQTSQTVDVTVIGDNVVEDNELFGVRLTNPSEGVIDRPVGAGTIIDDDSVRTITIEDSIVLEGNTGTTDMVFTLRLDQAAGQTITVDYASADDSATAGSDYIAGAGTVTFNTGDSQQQLTISVNGDTDVEGDEQFFVNLTNSINATLADNQAVGVIQDDDSAPPPPSSLDAELVSQIPTSDRCDLIDPNYCLYPWPNDYFTTASGSTDTGLLVNLNPLSMPINSAGKPIDPTEWNRNDGFSPGHMIQTRVEGLDLQQTGAPPLSNIGRSLETDSPILIIDADTGERHLIWSELDDNGTKQTTPAEESAGVDPGPALIIRPAINFEPGQRYIVALRNMRNGAGDLLTPAPGFQVYRDNIPSLFPQVEARRAHFEDLFTILGNAGVARNDLYLVWDFTVASERNLTERMLHIRDDALGSIGTAPPGFVIDDVIDNPSGTRSEITARRIRGHVIVPCYLNTPNCISGGVFNYQPGAGGPFGDGLPDRLTPVSTASVPFICSIARTTFDDAADPATALTFSPARIGLYGHGLLGARDEGNTYGGDVRDMAQEHNFVFCMVDWAGMATGNTPDDPDDPDDPAKYDPLWDGTLQDAASVASILADVSNFPKLGDRVQQGILNFIFLGRLMLHDAGLCTHPAFQVAGQCVLDRSELFYDGNSQGGIIGGALMAVSPDIRAGVLGVPGMNYSTLLRRSVDFDFYATAMYAAYRSSLDQTFVLSLIQMLWDRAETNGYATFLRPGNQLPGASAKRILLHTAFSDHQVTSYAAEVEARTMQARVPCPSFIVGPDAQRGPKVMTTPHPFVGTDPLDNNRRHPDDEPLLGLDCISYPHTGNALIMWDSGPRFDDAGNERTNGYSPPPIGNVPPRPEEGYGADPHGHPRSEVSARVQKSEFLRIGGGVIDVCNGEPCTARGFDPSP